MTYNWQQAVWPKVTVNKAALQEELKAFESPNEPLSDPINDPIKHAVLTVVEQQPGCQREQIAQAVGKSVETVKRAIAALIAAGRIEHRGSKKTGGYFAVEVAQ